MEKKAHGAISPVAKGEGAILPEKNRKAKLHPNFWRKMGRRANIIVFLGKGK